MRRFTLLLLVAVAAAASAQSQGLRFQLLVGAGMAGITNKGGLSNFTALALPRISAGVRIPLTERVAFLSGIDWQKKGYRIQMSLVDTQEDHRSVHNGRTRYSQINIPVLVSVRIIERGEFGLECSGGMSYGFMLDARTSWSYDVYRRNAYRYTQTAETEYKISLLPYGNRVANPQTQRYGALARFNPAFAGQMTFRYQDHYLVQAYAEYNLYDASSTSTTPMHLYSLGLCLGYRL